MHLREQTGHSWLGSLFSMPVILGFVKEWKVTYFNLSECPKSILNMSDVYMAAAIELVEEIAAIIFPTISLQSK